MENTDRYFNIRIMKLKKKHFEIVQTISYFVDKNYFPNFTTPDKDEIEVFITIESKGVKSLDENQQKIYGSENFKALLDGKENYDLQINMVHEELADWVENNWGWFGCMDSIFKNAFKDRKLCKFYIKALIKIIRNIRAENSSAVEVLLKYSGFSDERKQLIIKRKFS